VVEGSVTTPRLTIAEGASIDAAVHMGESP
jgi:hypothetical protein